MIKPLLAASLFIVIVSCKKDSVKTYVNNPIEGEILVAPYSANAESGKLLILDELGNTIKEKTTPGVAMNFQKWTINGNVRYTYLVEDGDGYHIPGYSAYIPGYQVIADENLNELKRIYLLSHNTIDATAQPLLDAHDFILLDDEHYIVMSYYEKKVTNIPADLNPSADVRLIAPVIQEIKNDQVIFQWDGTEHPELYYESVEGNSYSNTTAVQDYLHINSMFVDPNDDNLICSFRNANLVLKINRTDGSIVWKLGGKNSSFTLSNDQVFLRQHNVTLLTDGTLLMFDNGAAGERTSTRIVEMQLNEAAKTITSFSAYTIPEDYSQYMGSVQKINDSYFIGGGTGKYILEINPVSGVKSFEMKLDLPSYRSFKY